MTDNEYIIELLELLCYNCGIDTESVRTGIKYRYDLYYKGSFIRSFDSRFSANNFGKCFFGEEMTNLHIKKIAISQ